MKPNITELIVNQDKCIGCGVCDTICPVNVLNMDLNSEGLYQPFETDGCLDKCTLCIDVCPFIDTNKDEKSIAKIMYKEEKNLKYHNDLGYFISTYEVHKKDEDQRLISASGGGGHAILQYLLEENIVDYILSVEPNDDPEKLFKFSIFENVEEIQKSRGSVYYPTELSEVLDFVMENEGNYAITVLPCYAKAIRLAQGQNQKLRKRIKFLVGLVCGQMKTKEFTHQLAKNVLGEEPLASVRYRVKQVDARADNYAFEFKSSNGLVKRTNLKAQGDSPSKMWGSRMFTPMACNTCTDVFAHTADIVIMDAWLPEYKKDYRGHTLMIVRSNELNDCIKNIDLINIKSISHQKVFNSQKGVVTAKNTIALGSINPILNVIAKKKIKVQKLSNENYAKNKDKIDGIIIEIKKLEKINSIAILPKRAILKIRKKLIGY